MKTAGQQTPACDLLTDVSHTLTLGRGGCASWAFANAGAQGYYRTAYSSDVLRAMAPVVESELTAAERLSLIDDEWALVNAGRHRASDYLTLASGYGREHTSGVLGEVINRLGFIAGYLTDGETKPKMQAFTRTLLRPLFDELGFPGASTDSDDRRALRATVVHALGRIAEDSDVIAKSRSALDRALAGGAALEPTLAGAVVTTAAAHGDAKLFDALTTASGRAGSPEDRYRYQDALAEFRDPGLIDRALQRALSPSMRSQDTATFLARFFENPAARELAWSFITTRWSDLQPKLSIVGADTRLVASLGAFCDRSSRDRIRTFFDAHKLPGAVRTLEQTLERIDNCIALREKETPSVREWLAQR